MLRKIVLGALLVALIGILVVGGVVRTIAKTGDATEELGQGHGQDADAAGSQGQGHGATGQSSGRVSQGNTTARDTERQYPNYETAPEDWAIYQGTVIQSPTDGGELVIESEDGEEVPVGTGPGYMEAQGFALQAGELVRVQGYWEGGEFKAAQVTRLRDGRTAVLRDDIGRPAWAGGNSGAAGVGEAEVGQWLQIQGTVMTADSVTLVVQAPEGQEIAVEGRAWSFAQEQGFSAEPGDRVTLLGFYEDDPSTSTGQRFEVGHMTNHRTGQVVAIREENGRPLWAGTGRRAG